MTLTLTLIGGKRMKCDMCNAKGATLGCFNAKCDLNFHFGCAQRHGCKLSDAGMRLFCKKHRMQQAPEDQYPRLSTSSATRSIVLSRNADFRLHRDRHLHFHLNPTLTLTLTPTRIIFSDACVMVRRV